MPRISLIALAIVLATACGSAGPQATPAESGPSEAAERIFGDAEAVEVLIATSDIAKGTPWSRAQDLVEVASIPVALRPSTFVSPDDPTVLVGRVALGDIPRNQIIVAGLFVDIPPVSTGPGLPAGLIAFSFPTPGGLESAEVGDVLTISSLADPIWPIEAEVAASTADHITVLVDEGRVQELAALDGSDLAITGAG